MTYFVHINWYNATCVNQIIIYYILKTASVIKRKQQQCFGTHAIMSAFLRNALWRKPDILFFVWWITECTTQHACVDNR